MKTKFTFSLTGFIIGMILISMISISFAMFFTGLSDEYNIVANNTFAGYNKTQELKEESEKIREATSIKQDEGILDVIGGFFSAGYNALKLSGKSVDLFVGDDGMLDEATRDVPTLATYKDLIIAMILIGIFVGIFLTVLVKWAL